MVKIYLRNVNRCCMPNKQSGAQNCLFWLKHLPREFYLNLQWRHKKAMSGFPGFLWTQGYVRGEKSYLYPLCLCEKNCMQFWGYLYWYHSHQSQMSQEFVLVLSFDNWIGLLGPGNCVNQEAIGMKAHLLKYGCIHGQRNEYCPTMKVVWWFLERENQEEAEALVEYILPIVVLIASWQSRVIWPILYNWLDHQRTLWPVSLQNADKHHINSSIDDL